MLELFHKGSFGSLVIVIVILINNIRVTIKKKTSTALNRGNRHEWQGRVTDKVAIVARVR